MASQRAMQEASFRGRGKSLKKCGTVTVVQAGRDIKNTAQLAASLERKWHFRGSTPPVITFGIKIRKLGDRGS